MVHVNDLLIFSLIFCSVFRISLGRNMVEIVLCWYAYSDTVGEKYRIPRNTYPMPLDFPIYASSITVILPSYVRRRHKNGNGRKWCQLGLDTPSIIYLSFVLCLRIFPWTISVSRDVIGLEYFIFASSFISQLLFDCLYRLVKYRQYFPTYIDHNLSENEFVHGIRAWTRRC